MLIVDIKTVAEADRYAYYHSKLKPELWLLPRLVGTERQCTWANDIREKFLTHVELSAQEDLLQRKITMQDRNKIVKAAQELVDRETAATYWIDNRNRLDAMYKDVKKDVL